MYAWSLCRSHFCLSFYFELKLELIYLHFRPGWVVHARCMTRPCPTGAPQSPRAAALHTSSCPPASQSPFSKHSFKLPSCFKMRCPKSGFGMCFTIGSQHLWCRESQPKHVSNPIQRSLSPGFFAGLVYTDAMLPHTPYSQP